MSMNRYLRPSNTIVYNRFKVGDGWRVEAVLPKQVRHTDRIKVLNWLQDYRVQLKKDHPLWIVSMRTSPHIYSLDITPVHNGKELIEKGQNARGIWSEIVRPNV